MSIEEFNSKIGKQNLKEVLLQSLPDWYPELTQSSYTCVEVQNNVFRWSEHFVYQILSKEYQHKQFLVKILHEKDKKGRFQGIGIRPSKGVKLEYQALASIYNGLERMPMEGITAVRPLAYYLDMNAIVLEYLPSKHFLSVLLDAGAFFRGYHETQVVEETARRGGQLLAVIHRISRDGYPQYQPFNYDNYLTNLQGKASVLFNLVGDKHVRNIIDDMQYLLERMLVRFGETVVISHLHGDYYPENIVRLPDGRVFTIDTTLHQIGPVEQDIAKFLIGIETTKRQLLFGSVGMRSTVPICVNHAFMKGYQSIGKYNRRVLLAFQFLALLQRWVEVLEVIESLIPFSVSAILKKTIIIPFMLKHVESLQKNIEEEMQ